MGAHVGGIVKRLSTVGYTVGWKCKRGVLFRKLIRASQINGVFPAASLMIAQPLVLGISLVAALDLSFSDRGSRGRCGVFLLLPDVFLVIFRQSLANEAFKDVAEA